MVICENSWIQASGFIDTQNCRSSSWNIIFHVKARSPPELMIHPHPTAGCQQGLHSSWTCGVRLSAQMGFIDMVCLEIHNPKCVS